MLKKDNYKWFALFLLWVAFFLQQGTRQIYSAALPQIQGSFGVDKTTMGVVGTVFSCVYGIFVPFAGITADLFRRKWMVAIGVLIFCLGIFASGFATGVGLLLVTYGILNGVGQTFYYPSATSLIGQLHKETRATALSILQCGLYAGIVGVSAVSGWFAEQGAEGWKLPFWIFGGFGVIWAVALAFLLRDTPPPAEAAAEKATVREAVRAMFSKKSAVCLSIGLGMMVFVDIGFKIWMPTYLHTSFSLPQGQAALYAVLWHYLGAFLGITFASRLSDRLVKGRPGIRMEMNLLGLFLGIPFIVLMAQASTLAMCCVGMGLFGVFRGMYDSNLLASLLDVIKPRYHASAAGIMLCCAFVFGSSSSTVLGWIGDHLSLQAGLTSLAVFYFLGGAVILLARLAFLSKDHEG